jgi:hypothetical protein
MIKRILIYVIRYYIYLRALKIPKTKVMNSSETVEYLLNNNISLIRLGDGEFQFFFNKGISYQRYEEKIKNKLLNIINEYNENGTKTSYLLAVPNYYFNSDGKIILKNELNFNCWARARIYFKKHFNLKQVYGDAFVFAEDYAKVYSQLWKDKNEIVFVHSNEECYKSFLKCYPSKNTSFVEIPPENAFSQIDKIKEDILEEIKKKSFINPCVLISGGPTAKIIVHDLLKYNVIAYDTGHCWDDPLSF